MNITFSAHAWGEYEYWMQTDRAVIKRIHALIKDICRDPFAGIGKPEPLKHQYAGYWSRRIDDAHRLVYCVRDGGSIYYSMSIQLGLHKQAVKLLR